VRKTAEGATARATAPDIRPCRKAGKAALRGRNKAPGGGRAAFAARPSRRFFCRRRWRRRYMARRGVPAGIAEGRKGGTGDCSVSIFISAMNMKLLQVSRAARMILIIVVHYDRCISASGQKPLSRMRDRTVGDIIARRLLYRGAPQKANKQHHSLSFMASGGWTVRGMVAHLRSVGIAKSPRHLPSRYLVIRRTLWRTMLRASGGACCGISARATYHSVAVRQSNAAISRYQKQAYRIAVV